MQTSRLVAAISALFLLATVGCQKSALMESQSNEITEYVYNPSKHLSSNPALAVAVGEYLQLAFSKSYGQDAHIHWIVEKHRIALFDEKSKCIFFTAVLLNAPDFDGGLSYVFLEEIYKAKVDKQVRLYWRTLHEHRTCERLKKGLDMIEGVSPRDFGL